MPIPPPVDATQRYPTAIRDFVTYMDQPAGIAGDGITVTDPTKVFIAGDGTLTDLTLDSAVVTKDLQTEIISLEQTIGTPLYIVPKTTSVGGSIQWLFLNKAGGLIDSRGAIIGPSGGPSGGSLPPAPTDAPLGPVHNHIHRTSTDLTADDHPQYMRVDGTRGFSAAVTAPAAANAHDLINLSQAKVAGLNSSQVSTIIQQTLAAQKLVPGEAGVTGPDGRRWKMAGGVAQGYTDINGNLWVDLTPCQFAGILSFNFMKMPFGGLSMLGWYNYQYMEDQLILMGLSTQGALIQFIEDIQVDRQATVCMCWMALGI